MRIGASRVGRYAAGPLRWTCAGAMHVGASGANPGGRPRGPTAGADRGGQPRGPAPGADRCGGARLVMHVGASGIGGYAPMCIGSEGRPDRAAAGGRRGARGYAPMCIGSERHPDRALRSRGGPDHRLAIGPGTRAARRGQLGGPRGQSRRAIPGRGPRRHSPVPVQNQPPVRLPERRAPGRRRARGGRRAGPGEPRLVPARPPLALGRRAHQQTGRSGGPPRGQRPGTTLAPHAGDGHRPRAARRDSA